jgi:hypothetical protein
VIQPILHRLNRLKHTIGDTGLDLINALVNAFIDNTNPPASSITDFICKKGHHPQLSGATVLPVPYVPLNVHRAMDTYVVTIIRSRSRVGVLVQLPQLIKHLLPQLYHRYVM